MHIHRNNDRKFSDAQRHAKTGWCKQKQSTVAVLEGDAFLKLEKFQWNPRKPKRITLAKVWK